MYAGTIILTTAVAPYGLLGQHLTANKKDRVIRGVDLLKRTENRAQSAESK